MGPLALSSRSQTRGLFLTGDAPRHQAGSDRPRCPPELCADRRAQLQAEGSFLSTSSRTPALLPLPTDLGHLSDPPFGLAPPLLSFSPSFSTLALVCPFASCPRLSHSRVALISWIHVDFPPRSIVALGWLVGLVLCVFPSPADLETAPGFNPHLVATFYLPLSPHQLLHPWLWS